MDHVLIPVSSLPVLRRIRLHVHHAARWCAANGEPTMTTKGNEITPMRLFREELEQNIRLNERALRTKIESLRRDLEGAIRTLDAQHRVDSCGIVQRAGTEIDSLCAVLSQLYDTRISLNAAL